MKKYKVECYSLSSTTYNCNKKEVNNIIKNYLGKGIDFIIIKSDNTINYVKTNNNNNL